MLNGDGLRVVLWVAGCNHCCKECQNPITWDPDGGLLFDEAAKQEIFEQLEKPYISGITFSGGDPMHPVNRADAGDQRKIPHEDDLDVYRRQLGGHLRSANHAICGCRGGRRVPCGRKRCKASVEGQ